MEILNMLQVYILNNYRYLYFRENNNNSYTF